MKNGSHRILGEQIEADLLLNLIEFLGQKLLILTIPDLGILEKGVAELKHLLEHFVARFGQLLRTGEKRLNLAGTLPRHERRFEKIEHLTENSLLAE